MYFGRRLPRRTILYKGDDSSYSNVNTAQRSKPNTKLSLINTKQAHLYPERIYTSHYLRLAIWNASGINNKQGHMLTLGPLHLENNWLIGQTN